MLLLAGLGAAPASAMPPEGTCFAVMEKGEAAPAPGAMRCAGEPSSYQDKALWLRLPVPADVAHDGGKLVAHFTRFEQITAIFEHPDGTSERQSVRRGAFGDRWRLGGQIAFSSEAGKPVTAVWLRVEELQSYELLRVRFLSEDASSRQFELLAFLIGAAVAMLAVAAAYNIGLGLIMRRRFFLWHGCWATTMLLWGLIWSQAALVVFPSIAGTTASRIATILSCAAVMFAAVTAASAFKSFLPGLVCRVIGASGVLVALLGVAASVPGANLGIYGILLSVATLLTLLAVAVAIGVGWRRGHAQARDLAISWALPMIMLGATQIIDFNTTLWGGGAQIAVLFASAFQTICLSTLATLRLNILRVQRDAAVAAGNKLAELANRDPLTGLLNRRGFTKACEQMFGHRKTTPFGLLLIDVDHFKSVNDRFGHEAGDAVLVTIGAELRALEQVYPCCAGRLGGEEFVIGVTGFSAPALRQFAETVRSAVGALDHSAVAPHFLLTVSIGVAEGVADGPFRKLYGRADRALYAAKRSGRNKVVFASTDEAASEAQIEMFTTTSERGTESPLPRRAVSLRRR
jgi:diguanylate cyclase (GGDEF)-like protein